VTDDVELGVELLAHLESRVTVKEAVDRIEALTTDPHRTREILDTAEKRGVVEREDAVLRPTGGAYVSFESDVVRREGEFTCRRCGTTISTGHFILFDAGEHGPFGSSCVRKVTGRDG
jgi:formamidopyrimidine-DNA glycosylase